MKKKFSNPVDLLYESTTPMPGGGRKFTREPTGWARKQKGTWEGEKTQRNVDGILTSGRKLVKYEYYLYYNHNLWSIIWFCHSFFTVEQT